LAIHSQLFLVASSMVASTWRQRLTSYAATCFFWFLILLALQVALDAVRTARCPQITVKNFGGRILGFHGNLPRASETAFLSIDMEADFQPVWRGTYRQLYVFIVAESKNASSQVTLWDKVVGSRDSRVIRLIGERAKYPLRAFPNETLRGNSITMRLHYMVMPYVGLYQRRVALGSADLTFHENASI
jgi:hypothetical protein